MGSFSNFAGNPPDNNNPNNNGNGGMPIIGIPIGNGSSGGAGTSGSGNSYDAKEFLIDYNDRFKNGSKAMFRDAVVQQTLATLISRFKPNPLLVGPAGTGKTKIAEDIAFRIVTKDPLIPDQISDYTVYELPLSNLVAGSGIVGQLEEKVKCIIDFASDPKNKVILFIDEIHMLLSESQIYDKIAQIMKPALARGDMHVIGATTNQEAQCMMDDPALSRRFQRIIVDELSRTQTIEILKNITPELFKHYQYKVSASDDILETTVILADEYHPVGSHRPDSAITLLDRSFGDALLRRKVAEEKAKASNNQALLAALQSTPTITLQESHIKSMAKRLMTGNNQKEKLDVEHLKEQLQVIKGQDKIIQPVIDMLIRHDASFYPHKRPLSLLFAGSSGVGKSEIVRIIAKEMTGVEPITLNMTEYHSSADINRIIGAPAGYVGSDSKAELPFDCLETNPYQIILLDEFEKCHSSVQRLFMDVFDSGNLTTAKGKKIDFSHTIIVATTNAACDMNHETVGFNTGDNTTSMTKENLIKDLGKYFDNELLNRFYDIMEFNTLSKEIYSEILKDKYKTDIARIKSEHRNVTLPDEIPDDDLMALTNETYVPSFGARPAGRTIQRYIEDKLI